MYDILIKNGKVIDGTGSPWFYADVAIKDKKVVKIAKYINENATVTIDAKNRFVCPGFIDSHSHSDFPLFVNPKAESKIRMGVTTEVIGQCGVSAAPRSDDHRDFFGFNLKNVGLTFTSFAEYLEALEKNKIAVNIIPLVGHGNIRKLVVGEDKCTPTTEQLSDMQDMLAQALKEGAHGMTTGLIYPPGCYSEINELIALGHTLNQYNAIYATHMRNEKSKLLESIKEAVAIGRAANIPIHISHYKACDEINWGLVKDGFKIIEDARAEGIDVTLDQYPYIASSTSLKTLIPQWAHDGGISELRKRLENPETRAKIYKQMSHPTTGIPRCDWVMVSSCTNEHNKKYEGLNLTEISEIMNCDPVNACLDLLLDEDFNTGMVRFSMCEEDVEHVMKHPLVMIGSDACCMATKGILSTGKPHPRSYGTFARVLGRYSLQNNVLPIENAVFKMTGLPATRFNLSDRGLLKEGFYADVTIFNPENIMDTATFKDPHQFPTGIDAVIVNGELVLDKDIQHEVFPGKVLRRK